MPPELKLTLTVPYSGDANSGNTVNTDRLVKSGLLPKELKEQVTIHSLSASQAEITFNNATALAQFARQFSQSSEAYLYDFDDNAMNGLDEKVITKPFDKFKLANLVAKIRGFNKSTNGMPDNREKWLDFFKTEGGLSDEMIALIHERNLWNNYLFKGTTTAENLADRITNLPKQLGVPIKINYWDHDSTDTNDNLFWLGAEEYAKLQAQLAPYVPTKTPRRNMVETNIRRDRRPLQASHVAYDGTFPPITQDAIDHPTRYLVYPLLKDKEGEIAINTNNPVKDISAYSPDMAKFSIPTKDEVLNYKRRFLSDGFEHPGEKYPIEQDFIQLATVNKDTINNRNIPVLVIPRMDQMCLPSVHKVDQTTTINGAFFNLDFTLTHDQFDEFTELMKLLPGDACVYERDNKGGHKIRLRVDEAMSKQAVDVLNEVIGLMESQKTPKGPEGNKLTDYEARVYAAYTLFKDEDVSVVKGLRDQIANIVKETASLSGSNVNKDNKEFITESRLTGAILIVVITLSSIPAFLTVAAMMGFETPWGRRRRYNKMAPDLVEDYRRKYNAGLHPGRTIIGRTQETRGFLTYLASMKIGIGEPTGGAVEAKGGTGKDFLFHAAAQALATGKYADGTAVEPWILEKVKRLRMFDPDVVIEGSSWKGIKERKFRSLMKTAEEELRGGDLKGEFVGGTFFITNEAADKSQKGADGMTGDVSVMKDVKEPVGNGTFPHVLVFATEDRERVYRTSGGQIDAQQLRRYPQIYPSGFEDQAPKEVAVILVDILVKEAREKGWSLPDDIEKNWPANPWEPPTLEDLEKISAENPLRVVCEILAEEARIYLPYQGNPSRSVQLMNEWIREALVSQIAAGVKEPISIASLRGYLRNRGSSEAKGLVQKIHLTMASIMDSQRLSIDSLNEQMEAPELLTREHVLQFASGLEPQVDESDQQYLNRLRGLIKFLDSINPRSATGVDANGGIIYESKALSQQEMATLNKQLVAIYMCGTEVVNSSDELQTDLSEIGLKAPEPPARASAAQPATKVAEKIDQELKNLLAREKRVQIEMRNLNQRVSQTSIFKITRIRELKRQLKALADEYLQISAQIGDLMGPAIKERLVAQIARVEAEIDRVTEKRNNTPGLHVHTGIRLRLLLRRLGKHLAQLQERLEKIDSEAVKAKIAHVEEEIRKVTNRQSSTPRYRLDTRMGLRWKLNRLNKQLAQLQIKLPEEAPDAPSPQPSPLEEEGKGEGEPPAAARPARAASPGNGPAPAARPAPRIIQMPPSAQPPAPPPAPKDPNARAGQTHRSAPTTAGTRPPVGANLRVRPAPTRPDVRSSADATRRRNVYDIRPAAAGPQCVEILFEGGETYADGSNLRVAYADPVVAPTPPVGANPSVRPTSARPPVPTSALLDMSFTDFVKFLYSNNPKNYEAVLSHSPKQQLIDVLMRMKALAKTDPAIKALYDNVSLTYEFIKAFNNENPGFFKEPEAMLNLFVRSRFKDGSNTNLHDLSADQFVAVYAERRAAELERVRTVERETLTLRGNLHRGMKRLERTLRETERIRRR